MDIFYYLSKIQNLRKFLTKKERDDMPNRMNYSRLSVQQQSAYNNIVNFGISHGFSKEEVSVAVNIAFAESSISLQKTCLEF